jgi:hypothetical protein
MKAFLKFLFFALLLSFLPNSLCAQSPCDNQPAPTAQIVALSPTSVSITDVGSTVGLQAKLLSLDGTVLQVATSANNTIAIAGLSPATQYTVKLQRVCPDGTVSCHATYITVCTPGIIIDIIAYTIGPEIGDTLDNPVQAENSPFADATREVAFVTNNCGKYKLIAIEVMQDGGSIVETLIFKLPLVGCCGTSLTSDKPWFEVLSITNASGEVVAEIKDFMVARDHILFRYRNAAGYYIQVREATPQ